MKFLNLPMEMIKVIMQKTGFVSTVALELISKRIRDVQENSKFWEEKYKNLIERDKNESEHYVFVTKNIYKVYVAEWEYYNLIRYFSGEGVAIGGTESFNNILSSLIENKVELNIEVLKDIKNTIGKFRINAITFDGLNKKIEDYINDINYLRTSPEIIERINVLLKLREFLCENSKINVHVVDASTMSPVKLDIEISSFVAVIDLKDAIERAMKVPMSKQALFFGDRLLHNTRPLNFYGIKNDSQIRLDKFI